MSENVLLETLKLHVERKIRRAAIVGFFES